MEENSDIDINSQNTPLTEENESATNATKENKHLNFNKEGEIIRPEASQQETPEEMKKMIQKVQELADESQSGLNPEDFSGEMKKLVKQEKEGSEAAAKLREKLRNELHENSNELPPIQLGNIRKK